MRCSRCGKKAAEVVAVARPRPRGVPKNPIAMTENAARRRRSRGVAMVSTRSGPTLDPIAVVATR
jgi:hypothetical protein